MAPIKNSFQRSTVWHNISSRNILGWVGSWMVRQKRLWVRDPDSRSIIYPKKKQELFSIFIIKCMLMCDLKERRKRSQSMLDSFKGQGELRGINVAFKNHTLISQQHHKFTWEAEMDHTSVCTMQLKKKIFFWNSEMRKELLIISSYLNISGARRIWIEDVCLFYGRTYICISSQPKSEFASRVIIYTLAISKMIKRLSVIHIII